MTDSAKIKFSLAQLISTVVCTLTIAGFWVRWEVRMNTQEMNQANTEKRVDKLEESDADQDNQLAIISQQVFPAVEPKKFIFKRGR